MENLCIIPARSGSKRIPHKNLKHFCDEPIIDYPFFEARSSGLFGNNIIISSDDKEILEDFYYWTIPRSEENSSDTATLVDVINEVLYYKGFAKPKYICLLLPTAVFVTKEDLIESYKMLKWNDSVVSITKYNHPIQRAFLLNQYDGFIQMWKPEHEFSRTQDLMPHYHDAGQFYWINVESFLQQQKIFMDLCVGYEIDAIDIDNEEDWQLAELKFKLKRGYKI